MNVGQDLTSELKDLAQAIGLVDDKGDLQTSWFEHPVEDFQNIFHDETQRTGLMDFFDALLPPATLDGLPAGEKWHPLLGSDPSLRGNLYLTVKDTGSGVLFGVAGDYRTAEGSTPAASLHARLPLINANSGVHAVAGTADGPLTVEIRITLGWTRPAKPIALEAVSISALLAPFPLGAGKESLVVTLNGLDLDGTGAKDTVVDAHNLGNEATHLVLGLIHYELSQIQGPAGEAKAVADHLLPLLGIGDAAIPPFPFLQLVSDPNAAQSWFVSLLNGAVPPIKAWLQHLVGLVSGAAVINITGSGTTADPWTAPVFQLNASSSFGITLAEDTSGANRSLQIGVVTRVAPGAGAPLRIEAQAIVASIPLAGTASASVLPSAAVLLRSPGEDGTPALVNNPPTISVGNIRGGLVWNGSSLQPILELDNVTLAGTPYPKLDLTNADSVVNNLADQVKTKLLQALGGGVGQHIAALAGMVPPTGDPIGSPHEVKFEDFVANPARAIAAVHRAVLVDPADSWSYLFGDLAGLLQLPGAVAGTGTENDPWHVDLGTAGPLQLQFAAWNVATGKGPSDVQKLRIGFRAAVNAAPFSMWWLSELLAFDLPNNAEGSVSLLGGQHAQFAITPLPSLPPNPVFTIAADSIQARMDWVPGGNMTWQAGVENIQLTVAGAPAVTGVNVNFPVPAFDVTDPAAAAAALSISVPQLEDTLRLLLARALLSWGGTPAYVVSALLGVHGKLPGLPTDWPLLADPTTPGTLLSDPFTALRTWLGNIATQVSSTDQNPFLPEALNWLQGLLSGTLPNPNSLAPPTYDVSIAGSGTYDDPWTLPLDDFDGTHAMVWLDPAGPPPGWAQAIANAAGASGDFSAVLGVAQKLAAFVPSLRSILTGASVTSQVASLNTLTSFFATSDGIVPLSSQIPTGGLWQAGATQITASHDQQPNDPAAISQILAQVNTWAAANPKVVLLLGPAFSDHTTWDKLLADPTLQGPVSASANFDFRSGHVAPPAVDLTVVKDTVDYYTADLLDDGTGTDLANQVDQINRIVTRLGQLRPGVPVTLVAHSTAGVPARVFATANPTLVRGVITLGTPHQGAPLGFLADNAIGDAIRLLQPLQPSIPAGPLQAALAHILEAMDGYKAPATQNAVAQLAPYPIGSFNFVGAANTDTGTVPALALGGTTGADLLVSVKQTLANVATGAAGAAGTPPTHLGFGLRTRLNLGAVKTGEVDAEATIRLDAFPVALSKNPPALSRPEHAARIRVRLSRSGDWLLGGPSTYNPSAGFVDVRARWAELGVDLTLDGGKLSAKPMAALHQASFHGPTSTDVIHFADAQAQPLLGAMMQAITTVAPVPTSALAGLLNGLEALGIAVPDPRGGIGLSADAFAALSVDASAYLTPRIAAALSSGVGGFYGPAAGPWAAEVAGLPLEIYVANNPAKIGVRTVAGQTLSFAANAGLQLDLGIQLSDFSASFSATLQISAFALTWSNGTISVSAEPWLDPLTLLPAPTPATLQAVLNSALPRILLSGAFTAILEGLLGPTVQIPPIDSFFSSPGKTMQGSSALGSSNGLSSDKINQLLQIIAHALRLPNGPGLELPASLEFIAKGAGTDADPTALHLHTTAPIAGVLDIDLEADIDASLHVKPKGTLTANIELPGDWQGIGITFGVSAAGVSLILAPKLAGVSPLQILPTFSGLGDFLRGALTALLPQALDDIVTALGPANPGTVLKAVLDIADVAGIHDATGFGTHGQQIRAMTQGDWLNAFPGASRAGFANAIANLFALPMFAGVLPGTVSASAGVATWSETLSGTIKGTVSVSLGWDGSGKPTALLGLSNVKLDAGGITSSINAGYASGDIAFSCDLGVALQSTLNLDITPTLRFAESGGKFAVSMLPLSSGSGDGPIHVSIAPTPGITLDANAAEQFVTQLLLPLSGSLVLSAVSSSLTHQLWSGGPTLEEVLVDAQLIVKGATPDKDKLKSIPSIGIMLSGVLKALAGHVHIPVTSNLTVSLISDGGTGGDRYGIALSGTQEFNAGSFTLKAHFGAPTEWGAGMDEGLGLLLFQSGASGLTFNPGLHCVGVGIGITGQDDGPLINTSNFRLGGVDGYFFFDVDFQSGVSMPAFGAGLELDAFGIPLGQATGSGVGGNPVAAGLLQSSGSGDNHPVNPGVDVGVWLVPTALVPKPGNDGNFHIRFGDKQDQPLWIPVHAGFGPIYIDQLGVGITKDPGVELLIDGSIKVDGLTAQAKDLGVVIPFHSLADPSGWSLDLGGLAIAFQSPGVEIAGGLLKSPGPPIEYDGMLLIKITQFGFVAVGAYSQPTDQQGEYTSMFIFAGVFIVIGLPPIIEIEGLGLGVGYNRELIVPDDMNKIPDFTLVAALDDAGKFASDPMGELMGIRDQMPARRGSFWLAVGLHGTSFVIVHVTAIVYVALDRGVEVGVLGVARMALPSDDAALVSIELALKARFSSAEGILSIQAQLTDNSWLLSHDCQLTGGFAYFMCFPKSQFVLTIGGYHPAFQKPPDFPVVPRLGYHWSLLGAINIKGESYFALTNTAVMAGARMEATYGPDCIHIWFTAYTDFLLSWDPFYYDISIGVAVGAEFRMHICFIGCCTIDISISLGASLHVLGPPLHGEVTVDLAICSVTVGFGPHPNPNSQFITDFAIFRLKYLYGNDDNGYAVANHVLTGLLPPEPAGGQPAPGTEAQPWRLGAEWSFQTETRMPASSEVDFLQGDSGELGNVAEIDLAPMGLAHPQVSSKHHVAVEQKQNNGSWKAPTINANHFTVNQIINQYSEATWHFIEHDNMPAAARTVPALGGLEIIGFALPLNKSAMIPIAKLIDAGYSRPLPFATLTLIYIGQLQQYGTVADQLGQLTAKAASDKTQSIAGMLLSGSGFFEQARVATGLPPQGLEPLAVNSLQTRRSAPPLITPITTGLTMKDVGLAAPPTVLKIPDVASIPLGQPRVRAVLQGRPHPVVDAPVAFRTTVTKAPTSGVPRMAPPRTDTVAGAHLRKIPAVNAVRPTVVARATKTLRTPEAGWATGAAHSATLQQAATEFAGNGVPLPAGATHIWDLPTNVDGLMISGASAVRVTWLSRSGGVLDDRELVIARSGVDLAMPEGAVRVVVTCLGNPPGSASYPEGFGALSAVVAPRDAATATGWQSASMLVQASNSIFLGRGAAVRVPRPVSPVRAGQKTSQTVIRASEVMRDETAVETTLPLQTVVVAILLDQNDATAADYGDFSIAADGGTLQTPPLRVIGGSRRTLLYQVSQVDEGATQLVVSVTSLGGWRVAGVIGLPGQAQDWAVRMNGGVPEHLVPDGPLTADGQVLIRLLSPTGGPA